MYPKPKLPVRALLACLCLAALLTACGDDQPDLTQPYTITRGKISLTVEPALGGRLSSLTYDGKEVLRTVRDSAQLLWGSTVWTSPQADWGWPPPPAYDTEPYVLTVLGEHRLLLEGPRDPASMLRLRKRFVLGPDSDVGLTAWVTNESSLPVDVALWENTRLPYAGTFEFQTDTLWYDKTPIPPVALTDSTYRLTLDTTYTTAGKLFAGLPTGTVRYHRDGVTLTKHTVVKALYRTAPGQGPLEIYIDPVRGLSELELQGDYRTIAPGESNSMRTKWTLSAHE